MKILFVCVNNFTRSQIAEAFFNEMTDGHHAISAGLRSKEKRLEGLTVGDKRPNTSNVMKDLGYDIADQSAKGITEQQIDSVDIVVYMGEEVLVRPFCSEDKRLVIWDDLPTKNSRSYRYIYILASAIKNRVEAFIAELDNRN